MFPRMSSPQEKLQPVQIIVFWIIWFSILSGLLVIQAFAAGGMPSGEDHGNGPLLFQMLALFVATVAMVVRFVVIPKLGTLEKKLPAMIVGLAMSESIGILGAFVVSPDFGATRFFMLAVSIACIVLFAPVYAKPTGGGSPFLS